MSDSAQKTNDVVVVPILMYDDTHFLLVSDRETRASKWHYPSTRVAEGETLGQAASRAAWFKVGLVIEPSRFGKIIRTLAIEEGITLKSIRANLTSEEFANLPDTSPTGRNHVTCVKKLEIKRYLPHKRDRRLMTGGS
jgi:hypothetical protein